MYQERQIGTYKLTEARIYRLPDKDVEVEVAPGSYPILANVSSLGHLEELYVSIKLPGKVVATGAEGAHAIVLTVSEFGLALLDGRMPEAKLGRNYRVFKATPPSAFVDSVSTTKYERAFIVMK